MPRAGVEIVDAQHLVAVSQQPFAQMRAYETCPAAHQDAPLVQHADQLRSDSNNIEYGF
jgi:hypothetical protein